MFEVITVGGKQKVFDVKQMHRNTEKHRLNKELYEDCEFYRVPGGKKGFQTVSVYTGLFYESAQSRGEKLWYRLTVSGIFLVVFALFGLFCVRPNSFNYTWYVGIPEGLTVVADSYVLVTWLIYLTAETKMRAYVYRMTSRHLILACNLSAIASGVCAAGVIASLFASGFRNVRETLATAVVLLVCCGAMAVVAKWEDSIAYMVTQSAEQAPENGERIEYKK